MLIYIFFLWCADNPAGRIVHKSSGAVIAETEYGVSDAARGLTKLDLRDQELKDMEVARKFQEEEEMKVRRGVVCGSFQTKKTELTGLHFHSLWLITLSIVMPGEKSVTFAVVSSQASSMHQRAAQVAQDEVSGNLPFRISPELTLFKHLNCHWRSLYLAVHLNLERIDIAELNILLMLGMWTKI